jgi:hypothetical protein
VIYRSLVDIDRSKLAPLTLDGTTVTAAERKQAGDLSAPSQNHHGHYLDAMKVLIREGGRHLLPVR